MMEMLKEIYYVSWADLRFMRHSIVNVMVMSLMSPLLYLIAFGYGLGSSAYFDGTPYISFMIPGIVALSTLNSSFTSTATRLNVQRLYYRSFDEMLMCPIRCSSIIIGKSVLGMIRGIMSCSVILVLGLFLSEDIMITPMLVASVLVSCFTFACLGETAAMVVRSHQGMTLFNTLVILPMTFLCGTFFSISTLPDLFRDMLYLIPLTHTSDMVRASALGWEFPWFSMATIVGYASMFFLINMWLIRNRRL